MSVQTMMTPRSAQVTADAVQSRRALWLLAGVPALMTVGELALIFWGGQAGLLVYLAALVGIVAYRAVTPAETEQRLALALLLAPLTRVVALALPMGRLAPAVGLLLAGLTLCSAGWLIVRYLGLSRQDLRLTTARLPQQLLLAGIGFAIGAAAYWLISPATGFDTTAWWSVAFAVVMLLLVTGLLEELIFRGVMQTTTVATLGRWGLAYPALLFAILQIGQQSPLYVGLAFGVALFFGYWVQTTGSILGVALAHGLASVAFFFLMPLIAANAGSAPATTLTVVMVLGTLAGLAGLGFWLRGLRRTG